MVDEITSYEFPSEACGTENKNVAHDGERKSASHCNRLERPTPSSQPVTPLRLNGYAAVVDDTNRIYRDLVQVEVDMKLMVTILDPTAEIKVVGRGRARLRARR